MKRMYVFIFSLLSVHQATPCSHKDNPKTIQESTQTPPLHSIKRSKTVRFSPDEKLSEHRKSKKAKLSAENIQAPVVILTNNSK